jgi:hypothetical protein
MLENVGVFTDAACKEHIFRCTWLNRECNVEFGPSQVLLLDDEALSSVLLASTLFEQLLWHDWLERNPGQHRQGSSILFVLPIAAGLMTWCLMQRERSGGAECRNSLPSVTVPMAIALDPHIQITRDRLLYPKTEILFTIYTLNCAIKKGIYIQNTM